MPDEVVQRMREVAERHGPWTGHDIRLAEGVWTRGMSPGAAPRLRRVVQLARDLAGAPLEDLRVLDLGCLEGQYSVEFALQGAEVLGIEGRETNLAKARFAKEELGLERLELELGDVRSLSAERHGEFDVVLCLGLLYHLDAEDLFPFIARLREVCRRLLVLDTHIGLSGRHVHRHDGHEYRGHVFVEHSERASQDERERSLWASLDNPESFWPTRASLVNALGHAGFTSVTECHLPATPGVSRDRVAFAAVAGERVELQAVPPDNTAAALDVPEAPRLPPPVRNQSRVFNLVKRTVLDVRARRGR